MERGQGEAVKRRRGRQGGAYCKVRGQRDPLWLPSAPSR